MTYPKTTLSPFPQWSITAPVASGVVEQPQCPPAADKPPCALLHHGLTCEEKQRCWCYGFLPLQRTVSTKPCMMNVLKLTKVGLGQIAFPWLLHTAVTDDFPPSLPNLHSLHISWPHHVLVPSALPSVFLLAFRLEVCADQPAGG